MNGKREEEARLTMLEKAEAFFNKSKEGVISAYELRFSKYEKDLLKLGRDAEAFYGSVQSLRGSYIDFIKTLTQEQMNNVSMGIDVVDFIANLLREKGYHENFETFLSAFKEPENTKPLYYISAGCADYPVQELPKFAQDDVNNNRVGILIDPSYNDDGKNQEVYGQDGLYRIKCLTNTLSSPKFQDRLNGFIKKSIENHGIFIIIDSMLGYLNKDLLQILDVYLKKNPQDVDKICYIDAYALDVPKAITFQMGEKCTKIKSSIFLINEAYMQTPISDLVNQDSKYLKNGQGHVFLGAQLGEFTLENFRQILSGQYVGKQYSEFFSCSNNEYEEICKQVNVQVQRSRKRTLEAPKMVVSNVSELGKFFISDTAAQQAVEMARQNLVHNLLKSISGLTKLQNAGEFSKQLKNLLDRTASDKLNKCNDDIKKADLNRELAIQFTNCACNQGMLSELARKIYNKTHYTKLKIGGYLKGETYIPLTQNAFRITGEMIIKTLFGDEKIMSK
ncbi:hypothetical protein MIDIC_470018 [Alphaproteobacteria bacterium]